jgi:hypothetical protein
MDQEFNINEFAAEFVNQRIDSLFASLKEVMKEVGNDVKVLLKSTYASYLSRIGTKYGKTRSFFIRDEPRYLYEWYVPVGVSCGGIKIHKAGLSDIYRVSNFAVIIGGGGCGKSILLKHFLLNAIEDKKFVPVFIEMREMNAKDISLMEFVLESVNQYGLNMEENLLVKALKAGHFVLLLDGLDEIISKKRKKIAAEIEQLSKKYPENSIIVSSRPDERVSQLGDFFVFETLPLTKEQCVELVRKLPAEEEIKSKFIFDLEKGLYKKHTSFLSNPLLLSIMLLTYGFSADIPDKLSIFYNQAYEAMFQRHDALKGAFKRVKETCLDIQDFARVCSAFCIQCYDERRIKLSHTDAISYLENAKSITNLDYRAEDFLVDLCQSICMLMEDGLFLTFAHRSFQEYFAARFIVSSEPQTRKRLLERYKVYVRQDSVYKLVHELDPVFLEFEIILPFIDDTLRALGIKKTVTIGSFLAYTKMMWDAFEFKNGELWGQVGNRDNNGLMGFVLRNLVYLLPNEPAFTRHYEGLAAKHLDETSDGMKRILIRTADLTTSSPLIKDLFQCGSYFSIRALERLLKIREALLLKRKQANESLERMIFKKSSPKTAG